MILPVFLCVAVCPCQANVCMCVCICLWVIYDVQVLFLGLPYLHTWAWKHVLACHSLSLGWNPTQPPATSSHLHSPPTPCYPPLSAELRMCPFSFQAWAGPPCHRYLEKDLQKSSGYVGAVDICYCCVRYACLCSPVPSLCHLFEMVNLRQAWLVS